MGYMVDYGRVWWRTRARTEYRHTIFWGLTFGYCRCIIESSDAVLGGIRNGVRTMGKKHKHNAPVATDASAKPNTVAITASGTIRVQIGNAGYENVDLSTVSANGLQYAVQRGFKRAVDESIGGAKSDVADPKSSYYGDDLKSVKLDRGRARIQSIVDGTIRAGVATGGGLATFVRQLFAIANGRKSWLALSPEVRADRVSACIDGAADAGILRNATIMFNAANAARDDTTVADAAVAVIVNKRDADETETEETSAKP